MQSRRDQVQAHLFVVGRLTSGILRAEPDAPETPLRRTSRGLLIGTVLALLGLAGFAVWGLLFPGGSTAWRAPGTLILVKESGARYVYADGTLHPVLNYASGVLLNGSTTTVQVAGTALAGVPRGAPVGIPGAPDDLPDATTIGHAGAWRVCAGSGGTSVLIGRAGTPSVLPSSRAVLVTTPGSGAYLLWYGKRYRLPTDRATLGALGYADTTPRTADAAFLDAVPAGPDLVAPPVPGRGRAGPTLAGASTRLGELFELTASHQYYVLTAGGLRPVGRTEYDLLLALPETARLAYRGGAVRTVALSPGDLTGHTDQDRYRTGLPAAPPEPVTAGASQAVCVLARPSGATTRYGVFLADADSLGARPVTVPAGVLPSCTPASQVSVGASGGALVRALPAAGVSGSGARYLVTPAGIRYPLSAAAVSTLGYGAVAPEALPHTLVDLLPLGPTLDPKSVGAATAAVRGCG